MDYSLDQLTDCQSQMLSYWELIRVEIENIRADHSAFKTQDLPLARIKKIMKLDDDIKNMMISAEAPILFAKAAELFIRELTLRAWIHTERNRRRTLQRNDIAMAVSDGDTDQFDFLIDIVPREEVRGHRRPHSSSAITNQSVSLPSSVPVKSENSTGSNPYTTNGRIGSAQNVSTDVSTAGAHPQTVTITLGSNTATSEAGDTTDVLDSANHTQAIHYVTASTAVPSTATLVAGQSATTNNLTSSTTTTVANTTSTAPIQYVLQLPVGAGGTATGQPFQIQLLPQHFQPNSTDALTSTTVAGQAGTMLTDVNGNSVPLVQVVSQGGATGLTLPSIVQDANGQRTQILQLQMPELSTGRPTLLLQSADSMMGATALLASNSTDDEQPQITYTLHHPQQQQIIETDLMNESDQSARLLLTFADHAVCVSEAENEPGSNMETLEADQDVEPDSEARETQETSAYELAETQTTNDSVEPVHDNEQTYDSDQMSGTCVEQQEMQFSSTENEIDLGDVESVAPDGETMDDNPSHISPTENDEVAPTESASPPIH